MIFLVKKDSWSEYSLEHAEEVRKFLMYQVPVEGDILVVGPQSKHVLLDEHTKNQAIVPVGVIPVAAGDISMGLIVSWKSSGFGLETSDILRPSITKSLMMKDISY